MTTSAKAIRLHSLFSGNLRMPVAIEPWMNAFPLHLGFALITSVFLGVFFSLRPLPTSSLRRSSAMTLMALSGIGAVSCTASWAIQFVPISVPLNEFSRSTGWWAFLILSASVLLYIQRRAEKPVPQQSKPLQNAVIQEQLLIQSVAQVKKNIHLKDRVRQAKRNNLRSQMNPHFLFNVLTGIQDLLLREQGEKASHVFGRFRKLLMQGFMHNDQIIGSIQQELNHVAQYIDLESIRLSKPIGWKSKVNPSVNLERTPCPKFLLQPLVENAIWHGLSGLSTEDPQIEIHVFWEEENLILQVHDNGKGLKKPETSSGSEKQDAHQSRGTAILKERLDLLRHPGRLELRAPTSRDPYTRGVVAAIRLPLWALEPPPKPTEAVGSIKTEAVDPAHR